MLEVGSRSPLSSRPHVDNLTHGLLGVAIGVLLPTGDRPSAHGISPTRKAAVLAGLLAAELPDLDSLWPAADPVLHALRAHRGLSHSLIFTPVVALAAAAVAKGVFRKAHLAPIALTALVSVLLAHLLADLWTGWGTRLLLPFSDQRLTLDWALVVDPLITLPLLFSFLWAMRRPERWKRAAATGLLLSAGYLATRIALREVNAAQLARHYPTAGRVEVFPSWFALRTWRYVVVLPDGTFAAGDSAAFGEIDEQRRARVRGAEALNEAARGVATVQEAIAWARIPQVEQLETSRGSTVRVADLRYHLRGEPTLAFVIELDRSGRVLEARLERGGSVKSLLERWRAKGS